MESASTASDMDSIQRYEAELIGIVKQWAVVGECVLNGEIRKERCFGAAYPKLCTAQLFLSSPHGRWSALRQSKTLIEAERGQRGRRGLAGRQCRNASQDSNAAQRASWTSRFVTMGSGRRME